MKRLVVRLLPAFAPLLCGAQTLTLGECVGLAREHYPAVAQYDLLEKTARLDLSNAAKAWLPHGSVSGQLTWQNDVASLPATLTDFMAMQGVNYPGLEKTQYRVGLDLTQQIWDGGKVRAARKAVNAGAAVERRSLDVQLHDVEGRVEEIYFSVLLLGERLDRTGRSISLVDTTLQQMRSMYVNGVAMQSDCDQVEAKLLALKQQRTQLAASDASLRRILELFIGEEIGDRRLVLPEEDVSIGAAHPQLRLFDARLSSLAARETDVKASVMPTVGAFASGYYGYPGYNMFKNMQSHALSFNFMVGIKVAWNFGALYSRGNSLNKLRLQMARVESERQTFTFNNDMAVSESLGQIAALREIIESDVRIVELRRSVRNAAQSRLRNGVIDTTSLLTKITDVELAENDLAQHRIELIKAIYNLNHIRSK